MSFAGGKTFSRVTQNKYEPNSLVSVQEFLEGQRFKFAIPATKQAQALKGKTLQELDFLGVSPHGESLSFEAESREYDFLSASTVTVHIPLRKYVSKSDFFVSHCSALNGRPSEGLFFVEASDVFVSSQVRLFCHNENDRGWDWFFNVQVTRGVRFMRTTNGWVPLKVPWGRKGFVFRKRTDDWRSDSSVIYGLSSAKRMCDNAASQAKSSR